MEPNPDNALAKRLNALRNNGVGGKAKEKHGGTSELVRYTPTSTLNPKGSGQTRIVKLAEKKVDPFAPKGFKVGKAPKLRSDSPPPPILHSPPRKLSSEEAAKWNVPPCVSSWKNPKGYVIPLDKRLASDGRGLLQTSVNEKFAKLSESLYVAERHAREEVKLRAEMQIKLAEREKQEKEQKLREIAQKARALRSGQRRERSPASRSHSSSSESDSEIEDMTPAERREYRERQQLRRQRQRERERELRLSKMGSETRSRVLQKLHGRDMSEKIALGQVSGGQASGSDRVMYDQRLFNRSEGMSSGFTTEDAYNIYDKPLFLSAANAVYRPRDGEALDGDPGDRDHNYRGRSVAAGLGFEKGAETGQNFGPVEFEKGH